MWDRTQVHTRIPGGGGVHQDEVGDLRTLDLLHLAEHQDVLDSRHGGGDDVQGACSSEPAAYLA